MGDLLSRRRLMMLSKLKTVKYGYLYNWYVTQETGSTSIISTAMENAGWRIPNLTELPILDTYIGGYTVSGRKLKEAGTKYWTIDNGTNDYNFNWRGAGLRNGSTGAFQKLLLESVLWSNEQENSIYAYGYGVVSGTYVGAFAHYVKKGGLSIRLFRPATASEQLQSDGTACAPYIGNDSYSYPTVKIGTQVWLACNLAETKYRDGSAIVNVVYDTTWASLTTGAICAYNNDINNVFI